MTLSLDSTKRLAEMSKLSLEFQYGEKGWLFAILARMLENEDKVQYRKVGSRAFYRTKRTLN